MRDLVQGETAPVDVTLIDGEGASATTVVGTGLTITLDLRDRTGAVVLVSGKVAWLVAADGTVRFEPDAGDLKAERSPYAARFLVTDGVGNTASYPNGEADKWVVRR